jgi:hypothetical protein
VIAVSKVPVRKSTLVYGSADGGATVVTSDKEFCDKMKEAAERLHLKTHTDRLGMNTLHSATDIEGHIGLDGRRYLLDFGRAFPPEYPSST